MLIQGHMLSNPTNSRGQRYLSCYLGGTNSILIDGLMIWLWKRLHQWISNILICVHHANPHITSINNFANEMIMS
jgi:hypothetical protein